MTIKEMRQTTGMSQSKFAEYFGIPVRTIQEWEQERRTPPAYIVELIERLMVAENVEVVKMNERRFFVANDNGDMAGHDMDRATAEQCLAEMQKNEPDAGWEILEEEDEE